MTRQYDICKNMNAASRKHAPFVVILQADLLSDFATAVVAPLMHEAAATKISKLNPVVVVAGKPYRAVMTELAGISRKQLGETLINVQSQHTEFVAAIDLLFTGI